MTDSTETSAKKPPAWLSLGFRPFFLLGAIWACVATAMWLHTLVTTHGPRVTGFSASAWHAHEMIFGFALAVVAGFLLTAARNWTKRETLHGTPLLVAAAIWFLARLAMIGALPFPSWALAVTSLACPLMVTVAVGRAITQARSKRNYGIVLLLLAFTAAAGAAHVHSPVLAGVNLSRSAMFFALHLVVLLNVVIGGRIIPLFTKNRTGAATAKSPRLDRAAIGSSLVIAILVAINLARSSTAQRYALAAICLLAAALHLARMRTWGFTAAARVPMLAVLFAGYAWVVAGYVLIAVSQLIGTLPITLAHHALTIGVIGTMTIGMMTRVTLGHTGRKIVASRSIVAAFIAIQVAALARLSIAVWPGEAKHTWLVSGIAFISTYALFLGASAKMLLTPRPDGRVV